VGRSIEKYFFQVKEKGAITYTIFRLDYGKCP
jgi:hypothetical protein